MKIYISGPISDMPDLNRGAFTHAYNHLKEMGHEPVNPFHLQGKADDLTWEQCLKIDIHHLVFCDAILMLPGWVKSRGAKLELLIAQELGIKIISDLDEFKHEHNTTA